MKHVTCMGQIRNLYMVLVGKSKERDHSEDLGIDGRILKWILKKQNWRAWTSFIWLRTGIHVGLL